MPVPTVELLPAPPTDGRIGPDYHHSLGKVLQQIRWQSHNNVSNFFTVTVEKPPKKPAINPHKTFFPFVFNNICFFFKFWHATCFKAHVSRFFITTFLGDFKMTSASRFFRGLVAASALVLCLPSYALNSVGGVTWDPNDGSDFTLDGGSSFQFTRNPFQAANANGTFMNVAQAMATPLLGTSPDTLYCTTCAAPGTIEGFANLTQINGAVLNKDVVSRQLTAVFGGMTIFANGASPFGSNIGGAPWVRIYTDTTTTANGANTATAGAAANGTLWLELALSPNNNIGFSYVGPTTINPDTGGGRSFTISGDFEVVGGIASAFFAPVFGVDLSFGSSTSNFEPLHTSGSVSFNGNSIPVPEPGSLALLGAALIGLAAIRRRKSA